MVFNPENEIKKITSFIGKFFAERPAFKGAVLGISGGKDSMIAAALCARAIGKDNVLGVLMPNGAQPDYSDALEVCRHIGIKYIELNIQKPVQEAATAINDALKKVSNEKLNKNSNSASDNKSLPREVFINIPPRIRMTCLFAVALSEKMLVSCNSNLSEITVGYTTKWGDNVGDFAPLAHLTKTEVVAIGAALGLPDELVNKAPHDGLGGKTDEENLGFTYQELDVFIRGGKIDDAAAEKIQKRIFQNQHKRLPIPTVS